MSTLLIQTLFMNGRDRKVGNKAESYVCNWYSASLNFQFNEAFKWLLCHQCSAYLRSFGGGCRDDRSAKVNTILHSEKGNETLWIHTNTYTQIQICRRIFKAQNIFPPSKQKCLKTSPIFSWIHLHFITSFKTPSLFPIPTTTTTTQTRLTSIPRLFSSFHEHSCIYFSHQYFEGLT